MLHPDRKGRPEPNLVSNVQRKEDGKRNIGCEEIGDAPLALGEDLETVGKCEKYDRAQDKVGKVRLQGCAVWELMEHAVVDHGFAEAQIGDHDDNPGDETRNGRNVGEPEEDLLSGVGNI